MRRLSGATPRCDAGVSAGSGPRGCAPLGRLVFRAHVRRDVSQADIEKGARAQSSVSRGGAHARRIR